MRKLDFPILITECISNLVAATLLRELPTDTQTTNTRSAYNYLFKEARKIIPMADRLKSSFLTRKIQNIIAGHYSE